MPTQTTKQKPIEANFNIAEMRRQAMTEFFETIRSAMRRFDDLDAMERLTREAAGQLEERVGMHGNGARNGRREVLEEEIEQEPRRRVVRHKRKYNASIDRDELRAAILPLIEEERMSADIMRRLKANGQMPQGFHPTSATKAIREALTPLVQTGEVTLRVAKGRGAGRYYSISPRVKTARARRERSAQGRAVALTGIAQRIEAENAAIERRGVELVRGSSGGLSITQLATILATEKVINTKAHHARERVRKVMKAAAEAGRVVYKKVNKTDGYQGIEARLFASEEAAATPVKRGPRTVAHAGSVRPFLIDFVLNKDKEGTTIKEATKAAIDAGFVGAPGDRLSNRIARELRNLTRADKLKRTGEIVKGNGSNVRYFIVRPNVTVSKT